MIHYGTRATREATTSGRGLLLLTLLSLTACDFSVTNPGPIQDEFLDQPEAFESILNGMIRAHSVGMTYMAGHGGAIARETTSSGFTGTDPLGMSPQMRAGILTPEEGNGHWNMTQRARWVAEAGLERLRRGMPASEFSSSEVVARAHLWVGYTNRMLGENMCQAVVDGGPAQPIEVHLQRAEAAFSAALTTANSAGNPFLANVARAGRASVRVHLGDWAGARSDAREVPTDLVFRTPYFSVERSQFNTIAEGSIVQWRTYTTWGTWFLDYFEETGDARTPWVAVPGSPFGSGVGEVPWLPQRKYPTVDSDINVSSGREMRLIEAEALLREGAWTEALGILNQVRTSATTVSGGALQPWVATTAQEAWTALKRERGIELWLEGRRLSDLRRWLAEGTPGEMEDMQGRSLCFPIGITERNSNPNIS